MPTDTFSVAVSADDGSISRYDDSVPFDWPPTAVLEDWGVYVALSSLFLTTSVHGGASELTNAFIRFNTATLPDTAVVSAAVLKVLNNGTFGDTNNRSLNVEWYTPGVWPPSAASDYTTSVGTTAGSFDLTALTVSAVNSLTLTTPTNVSLSGYTSFRLGISYAGGATPTGFNRFFVESFDGAGQEPQLEVTYTVPATGQTLRPDADVTTTGWTPTPLWSRLDETPAGADIVSATAS